MIKYLYENLYKTHAHIKRYAHQTSERSLTRAFFVSSQLGGSPALSVSKHCAAERGYHIMKYRWQKICAFSLACILCLTALSGCSSDQSSSSKNSGNSQNAQTEASDTKSDSTFGKSLGEFTTQDINGKTYTQDIFKDYDLTLVNVFTTWCSPCVSEIPDLEKLHQAMADKGANVVGIVLDTLDENGDIDPSVVEKAQLLAEKTGATYPFLLPDETGLNGRLTGIDSFPETFFVDRNGNIVGETYSGSGSLEDWTEVVNQELENLKAGA